MVIFLRSYMHFYDSVGLPNNSPINQPEVSQVAT